MTRIEMRELKNQEENQLREFLKYQNHFLKEIYKQLKSVEDPRHPSYIKYGIDEILMTLIFKNICNIKSMTQMTNEFNTTATIENFKLLLDDAKIEEIPHYVTINELLKKLETTELEKIRKEIIKDIIRRKTFYNERLLNKEWKIIFDATHIFSFKERHCEHCLTQRFNRGTEEEYTIYSHKVLEAKLVLADNIIISIGTEFIENEHEGVSKQDCEIKAFKRLSEQIKKDYPRLPICILADSLYAANPIMEICKKNNWKYIIRFKDGSIKTVAEEFRNIVKLENKNETDIKYVNGINYKENEVNIVEYEKRTIENKKSEEKITTFKWITNIAITNKNVKEIIKTGRQRWKIENEGFNTQKNLRYNIKHANSLNYNAMKNHYLLTQIADIFLQLYTAGNRMIKILKKSIKKISSDILKWLTTTILSKDDINYIQKRTTIHFV
jgi:hypothetical protein